MSKIFTTFALTINMTTLIDISQFAVIDEVALQKTRYLRKYYVFSRTNGEKEEISFTYLRRLLPEHTEELPDCIARVFSDLGRVHVSGQNDIHTIGTAQVHISQFIWARLCVAAYFFFHNDPLWQNLIFRKLEERVQVPELAADILIAKNLIDEHYRERALITETIQTPQATPETAMPASSSAKPKPEEVFHIQYQRTDAYPHLLTFLNQEKTDCSDAEWARHALAIFRHPRVLIDRPATFSEWLTTFCAMFGRQVEYRDPNKLDRTKSKKQLDSFLE